MCEQYTLSSETFVGAWGGGGVQSSGGGVQSSLLNRVAASCFVR